MSLPTRPLHSPTPAVEDDDAALRDLLVRADTRARDLHHMPALSAFLAQMESWPTLDSAQQAKLITVVRAGHDAARRISAGESDRKGRLAAAERDGRRAAEALAGSSFRLVLLICREKAEERLGRERALDLMPDLVSEANVAVSEAIATFDPVLSPNFGTFVARKVRDRISATLNTMSPVSVAASWTRLKRIASVRIPELEERLGRRPTTPEIQADLLSACMEWAEKKLTPEESVLPESDRQAAMMARLRKQGMLAAITSIEEVLAATQSVAYLDAPLGDGSGSLGDLVSGNPASVESFTAGVESEELRRDMAEALAGLTEREQRIVACRYGFVDGEMWTYPRIAAEFGVTAERIRQIERAVLTRLKEAGESRLRAHL